MLLEKLKAVEDKYESLNRLMTDPTVISDYERYQKYSKEQSELAEIVGEFRQYKKILEEIEEAKEILSSHDDDGLKELAQEELPVLQDKEKMLERANR